MSARTPSMPAAPHESPGKRIPQQLRTMSVIVVVLGVLPILWHASAIWQISGCIVSAALTVHATRMVWREVISTHSRYSSGSA